MPSPATGSTALRTLLRLLLGPSACAELAVAEALLVIVTVFHTLQENEHHSSMWFAFSQRSCTIAVPRGLVKQGQHVLPAAERVWPTSNLKHRAGVC